MTTAPKCKPLTSAKAAAVFVKHRGGTTAEAIKYLAKHQGHIALSEAGRGVRYLDLKRRPWRVCTDVQGAADTTALMKGGGTEYLVIGGVVLAMLLVSVIYKARSKP